MLRSSLRIALATAALAFAGSVAGRAADSKTDAAMETVAAEAQKWFPNDDGDTAARRRIFRLTREQLDATVAVLLPGFATLSIKELMPKDPLQTNYEFAELLRFHAANIAPLAKWIEEIAARVGQKPGTLITCGGKPDPECLEIQAHAFVTRAYRGNASAETISRDVAFYLERVKAAGFPQATADLVEVVLNSPHFLYRKDIDTTRRGWRSSPAALLANLTYMLGDGPPETLGLDARSALEHVQTADRREGTLDRILASKEAREKLIRFFKAWLEVKDAGEMAISPMVYPEFTPKLAAAMVAETEAFLRKQLGGTRPRLSDITQVTPAEVPAALASIYAPAPEAAAPGAKSAQPKAGKAAPETAAARPSAPMAPDPAQRLGIFSKPAVIASHSGPVGTQPIKRGVFWVRKVMCMDLEPPPPDAHKAAYAEIVTTERQRIEQSTRTGACYGCHKVINPLGFFLESYDPLGRWRTTENGHPVDSSVDIDFLDEGNARATTPTEAIRVLTASSMFKQCFVRQLFRFYMGRKEDPADDPVLRDMYVAFARGNEQQILPALRTLATSSAVTRRSEREAAQ